MQGRTLGGSSSVNGMLYNRGHRADHDALATAGNPGWSWDDMLPVFRSIEDNSLGGSPVRGADGPLQISTVESGDPLLEDVITAGTELGWQRVQDLNETDEERIGYAMATIRDGRRCSAADSFLHPRSEERRVGKERRIRGWRADREKKKTIRSAERGNREGG